MKQREIGMGEIKENWQNAKFYCSEIKLIYSTEDVFMIICVSLYRPDKQSIYLCSFTNLQQPDIWYILRLEQVVGDCQGMHVERKKKLGSQKDMVVLVR